LKPRGLELNDVAKDFGAGHLLVNVLEVLSEQKFPHKMIEKPSMRIQAIQNLSLALKFNNDINSDLKTQISPENFADSNLTMVIFSS
jgi:hypothetical protein